MSHRNLTINQLTLSFPGKLCFEDFSTTIHAGQRIFLIGPNGSGKSTLLKIIQGLESQTSYLINRPEEISFGYLPQVLENSQLSGGQRLLERLSSVLREQPNFLCLDEPTNHLDQKSRNVLMRMLDGFQGTLLIVSHDEQFLRRLSDTIWKFQDGQIKSYQGGYDNYLKESFSERARIKFQTVDSNSQKKQAHKALMKEQQRASKKKAHGEKKYDGDKLALRSAQGRGERTHNLSKKRIGSNKSEALEMLAQLKMPEIVKLKFSLKSSELSPTKTILQISNGSCGYEKPVLENIDLQLKGTERIAITGDNGSGKSTLLRAILDGKEISRAGNWEGVCSSDIGYLDQHYANLDSELSVLEHIQKLAPAWTMSEIRTHLNCFLFRKNEEVNKFSKFLSGGEKARLSLACIAASTPKLLILDEVTNNLDLETKTHVIQVLRNYPGAMIVVSHDEDLLDDLDIKRRINLNSRAFCNG